MRNISITTTKGKVLAGLVILAAFVSMPISILFGDHISQGVNHLVVSVSNPSTNTLLHGQVATSLSSRALIDGFYMDADAFNTSVTESGHVGYMPGTGNVRMLGCFDTSGNDETADCNSTGIGDITLPVTGSEFFEFAGDNQFRVMQFDISTPAVADWAVTWEYWNGSSYVPLSNVTDGTDDFRIGGLHRVSWDFPAEGDWGEDTLHGISGYWVQARVSSVTSVATPPVGTQVWYETGRWWMLADELGPNEGTRFDLQLDTPLEPASAFFNVTTNQFNVLGIQAAYPPDFASTSSAGNSDCQTVKLVLAGTFVTQECLMSWDTSSLPDKIEITDANLTCQVDGSSNADTRSLFLEWFGFSGVAGNRHYAKVAQNNAHIAGTSLNAMFVGQPVTMQLDNLYRINTRGTTGIRGHISGGAPTGTNSVDLSTCILSVTYHAQPQHHQYFPFSGGYTLADAASLEPGDTFGITIAGYFDTRGVPAKGIWGKANSRMGFEISPTIDNALVFAANGSAYTTTTAVLSGYHTLEVHVAPAGDGNTVTTLIDGVEAGNTVPVAITDVADGWVAGTNNAMPYMDYVVYEINQTDELIHQIRDLPGALLEDHTGNGHVAIARYPETVDDYTVSLGSVEPTEPVGSIASNNINNVIGTSPSVPGFSNTPTSSSGGFFLFDMVSEAIGGSFPYQAIVSMFTLAVIIMLMVGTAVIFHEAVIAGFVGEILLIIAWQMQALPGWMPILFAFPMLLFLVWKRATP